MDKYLAIKAETIKALEKTGESFKILGSAPNRYDIKSLPIKDRNR